MNASKIRSLRIGSLLIVTLLVAFAGWFFFKSTVLEVRIAFAAEQTEVFDSMRSIALELTDPAEAVGYMDYVDSYYPSGTKQLTGSPLDGIVERCRAIVVQDIIVELRRMTDEDLGSEPQAWIDRYGE